MREVAAILVQVRGFLWACIQCNSACFRISAQMFGRAELGTEDEFTRLRFCEGQFHLMESPMKVRIATLAVAALLAANVSNPAEARGFGMHGGFGHIGGWGHGG